MSHLLGTKKTHEYSRVFYLKVNRRHRTSYPCIQQWLNLAHHMNGQVFFVCDDEALMQEIKQHVALGMDEVSFMASDYLSFREEIAGIVQQGKWQRIAHAMLTPFIHAAKHGYKRTYNIDADDIEILLRTHHLVKVFHQIEQYADEQNMDCLNLDMFLSLSFGMHWSFGCVYVRRPQRCLDLVRQNAGWFHKKEIMIKYKYLEFYHFPFNVDLFFTYLRDSGQLKCGTFYIENAYVVHMPDGLLEREWTLFFKWSKGEVYFPVLHEMYGDSLWSRLPIAPGLLKVDVGIKEDDKQDYMQTAHYYNRAFHEGFLNMAMARGCISPSVYRKYSSGNNHCQGTPTQI